MRSLPCDEPGDVTPGSEEEPAAGQSPVDEPDPMS